MRQLLYISLSLILFSTYNSLANERTLYVDKFNSILGNQNKEDKLLFFCQDNNFTTLVLYELHLIRKRLPINDKNKIKELANFIKLAKTKYNVKSVIASGENSEIFLNYIHIYNQTRTSDIERFNGYNIEYEYWNKTKSDLGGYYCENYLRKNKIPCTEKGSFNYFEETISILSLLKKEVSYNIDLDVYITNFTKNQIERLKKYDIKYRLSAYAGNVKLSSKQIQKELKILSSCKCLKDVSIILSSELFFMSGHLKYNSLDKTERKFKQYISKYKNLNITEFTYFKYTDLKKSVSFEKRRRTGVKQNY